MTVLKLRAVDFDYCLRILQQGTRRVASTIRVFPEPVGPEQKVSNRPARPETVPPRGVW